MHIYSALLRIYVGLFCGYTGLFFFNIELLRGNMSPLEHMTYIHEYIYTALFFPFLSWVTNT